MLQHLAGDSCCSVITSYLAKIQLEQTLSSKREEDLVQITVII